ncbi:RepB plasmid partitioning protein [Rhodovulum kholense]|uniref:RepB plasmid partitioning protein n=1 Tax=Rhodovulum kholense TaxID=453584 RepID=A0A8E2VMN7_9RHOB|nr:RepB plasmid partitioning protein [Rhodovulum kholense]
MTSAALVRAYRIQAERQQDMIRRAQSTRDHRPFLDAAFQSQLGDGNFVTLLRAERLASLPSKVVDGLKEHRAKTPPPKGPGFEPTPRQIPITGILPLTQLPSTVPKGRQYAQIAASIREAGLIELLVVARARQQDGTFNLLDGPVRLHVLKEIGPDAVTSLVATDDASFTCNKRIGRLATIQEHKMILRAIGHGAPEARIIAALNVDVALIRRKRTLLNGICPEAIGIMAAVSEQPVDICQAAQRCMCADAIADPTRSGRREAVLPDRRRGDPEHPRRSVRQVAELVRQRAFEMEGIAFVQVEGMAVDPDFQTAPKNKPAFLARMTIGVFARPATRLKDDIHHLKSACIMCGHKGLHHAAVAEIDAPTPVGAHDHSGLAVRKVIVPDEKRQDGNVQHSADGPQDPDRRRRDAAFDLAHQADRDARAIRDLL